MAGSARAVPRFRINLEPLGEGTIRPQGPFPQTPNPLPLFSVAEEEQDKQMATPNVAQPSRFRDMMGGMSRIGRYCF
jgi:hypothetical protein